MKKKLTPIFAVLAIIFVLLTVLWVKQAIEIKVSERALKKAGPEINRKLYEAFPGAEKASYKPAQYSCYEHKSSYFVNKTVCHYKSEAITLKNSNWAKAVEDMKSFLRVAEDLDFKISVNSLDKNEMPTFEDMTPESNGTSFHCRLLGGGYNCNLQVRFYKTSGEKDRNSAAQEYDNMCFFTY